MNYRKFEKMRVTVLGAGSSGLAAVDALVARDARVFLSDAKRLSHQTAELDALGVGYEENGHTARALDADVLVVSPGIPWEHPLLRRARAAGLPLWSELELGFLLCPSRNIVAITGTNGKSTTTRLVGALLRARGQRTVLGGNLGPPFCALLDTVTPETWVVLEVSSFQLEGNSSFKPHIGVWLNLAPDHLDRHHSIAHYRALKEKLFAQQTELDHAVLGLGLRLQRPCKAQRHSFVPLPPHDSFAELPRHQRENLAAALCAARLVDERCSLAAINWQKVIQCPHCLEFVDEVGSVRFYNDSKATNPHATQAALESLKGQAPLCLILGGCHKGIEPHSLARYVASHAHVAQAILVGPSATRWERALLRAGFSDFCSTDTLNSAVRLLNPDIHTCILSPAAASFDQFFNYQARGIAFKAAVASLKRPP